MAILVAGLLALALVLVGALDAFVRGRRLWRETKRVEGEAAPVFERISATGAQVQEQLARAQASGEELRAVAARLQGSQARLQVQLDAVTAARAEVRRVLWFVPGV
jgi:hypothetical protein